jgi:hypothetical protein
MANIGHFDATQVAPNTAFEVIPAGWYNVQITQSEVKPTRDQQGAYLELGMRVMDGEHSGRMLFDRLNLHNANPIAVEIAYKTLSAICHATGTLQITDSEQLHGKPMQAKVTVRPPREQYEASNEVKGYRPLSEAGGPGPFTPPTAIPQQPAAPQPPAQAPAAPQPITPPPAAGGTPTPPWAPAPAAAPAAAPAGQPEAIKPPWVK